MTRAMKFAVRVGGLKRTRGAIKNMARAAERTTDQVTEELAYLLLQTVHDRIRTGPKTGRVYRRENPTRVHQASAPGQSPAEDLGTLSNSFAVQLRKLNQYARSATVGSELAYASKLEYGDISTNLLPRPFFRPAIDEVEDLAGGKLVDIWRRQRI